MGFQFPDAREALYTLLDGQEFAGQTVTAYFQRTTDWTDHLPAVTIYQVGGNEGFISNTVRLTVEVYADGTLAQEVAVAIKEALADKHHDVPDVGLIDRIEVESLPTTIPYASDKINLSVATYRATSRPL